MDEAIDAGTALGLAIEKLGAQLSSPKFRQDFVANPQAALQTVGIDPATIPPGILNAFTELSTTELRLLGGIALVLHEHEMGGSQFPL